MAWRTVAWWITMTAIAAPIVAALALRAYQLWRLPQRIPRADVQRLADEVIREHPDDPDLAAFQEEEAAWSRGDAFEQGKWRRVRHELRRRE